MLKCFVMRLSFPSESVHTLLSAGQLMKASHEIHPMMTINMLHFDQSGYKLVSIIGRKVAEIPGLCETTCFCSNNTLTMSDIKSRQDILPIV